MNEPEPTYSFDETVEILAALVEKRDFDGIAMLEDLIKEEAKRYGIVDLWIFKSLFEYAKT